MKTLTARALDTDVSISSDDDGVLAGVAAVIATYPPAVAEPSLRYVLDSARGAVFRDDALIADGFAPPSIAPYFERDLYDVVIERAAPSVLLHAAALVRDGRAVLLFGPSGAGKTTMSRALIARGAQYITDEIAAVDSEQRVRGLPRPLSLAPDSPPEDPIARSLGGRLATYRFIARDGTDTLATLFAPLPEVVVHRPTPVAAVVRLRHAPSEPAGAVALAPGAALPLLWSETLRGNAYEIDLAVSLLREVPAFDVVTHSIEGGVQVIDGILSRG